MITAELRLSALTASPGRATARCAVWRVCDLAAQSREAKAPDVERTVFDAAVKDAQDQLSKLVATVDEEAADILEFQLELLEEFAEEVRPKIVDGQSCDQAWIDFLDVEIENYRESGEPLLESRASDLIDLKLRVLRAIFGAAEPGLSADISGPVILLAKDLAPSEYLQLDLNRVVAIVLGEGSPTSHVALLAKSKGTPMIVGAGRDLLAGNDGALALLDADSGTVLLNPAPDSRAQFERESVELAAQHHEATKRANDPAITADGERVWVYANIDDVGLLDALDPDHFDGIGLVRTEFMFSDNHAPDEDEQFANYLRLVKWAGEKPVTIRTLDAGGDKPIRGVSVPEETNPFLGLRGYRLSRTISEMFAQQLRALARAAAAGNVKIMIPMVTEATEMSEFRRLFAAAVKELEARSEPCTTPDLGFMIEVPAAALCVPDFDADFCSIGSNDLIQYTTAAARDNAQVSYLSKQTNPGLLRLIHTAAQSAASAAMPISVCGDMASNKEGVHSLLAAGIRSLSVAPAQAAIVKQAVREWSASA